MSLRSKHINTKSVIGCAENLAGKLNFFLCGSKLLSPCNNVLKVSVQLSIYDKIKTYIFSG